MKQGAWVVSLLTVAALAGCGTAGVAEDFKWSVECPRTVDRGAEFAFTVTSVNAAGESTGGVSYRYQILWTGGSSNPLRHRGSTGQSEKVHARLTPGPATIVVTCPNRAGLDTKVVEATFEVKQ
jgi:hypothetical protein